MEISVEKLFFIYDGDFLDWIYIRWYKKVIDIWKCDKNE